MTRWISGRGTAPDRAVADGYRGDDPWKEREREREADARLLEGRQPIEVRPLTRDEAAAIRANRSRDD